jgi:uncharacterized protein YjdB
VLSLAITPDTSEIAVGETRRFSYEITFGPGSPGPAGPIPMWSSSNPMIVRVEGGSGEVTGLAPGRATISITFHGTVASRELRVVTTP